jgi:hypothetical protein
MPTVVRAGQVVHLEQIDEAAARDVTRAVLPDSGADPRHHQHPNTCTVTSNPKA